MHIGLVGPIATADVKHLLDGNTTMLPQGYAGGPLLATLIGELLNRGNTVSAFTLSNDLPLNTDSAITATGNRFALHYVPMRPRAWRPNGWLPGRITDLYRFEIKELTRAILQHKPDILHAHWVYEFALAAIDAQIPHVITCHDSPHTIAKLNSTSRPTRSLYRWLRVLMGSKTFNAAQYITAVSPYMRDAVQALTRTRIQVVPNPVDDGALQLAIPRLTRTNPRVAMVCNGWDSRKNPKTGIHAFNKLLQDIPGATLHLYGNDFGPGQTAEKWCVARGIQKGIHFHGAMPHKQLLKELTKNDLLLHTSIEESFGMVIAEAMAMGLPIVAGNASGAVPWVLGDCGTLCDIRDAASVTAALATALIPERYSASSIKGIESVAARFTTTAVTDEFFALYKTAIATWPLNAENSTPKEIVA